MEFKRAHCPCLQLAAKLALESVRKEVESSRNARVAQGVHVPGQQQVSRGKGRGRRKAEQVSSKRVNDANLKIGKHVREGAGESINLKCRTRNNRELVRAFSLFNLGHNLLTSPRWRLNQFFFFSQFKRHIQVRQEQRKPNIRKQEKGMAGTAQMDIRYKDERLPK